MLRVEWLVMGVILAVRLAEAAPQDSISPPADMEFLEFLGSWEAEDGEVVDPLVLQDMPILDPTGVVIEDRHSEREFQPGRSGSAPQYPSPGISGENADD